MRIRRIDRRIEKDIIIGMITDRNYLARVRPGFNARLLKNRYSRTIATWAIDFFDKCSDCPFKEIETIFQYHQKEGEVPEEDVDLMEKMLKEAAANYSESPILNTDFLLQQTEEYFNRVNLEIVFAKAQTEMDMGKIKDAMSTVSNSKPIQLTCSMGGTGLTKAEKIQAAFEDDGKPLFTVPGDLGEMVNPFLTRDSFIFFQAGEKVGKTWTKFYLIKHALQAKLKVVLFSVGDQTECQTNKRLSISIAGKSDKKRYCGTFKKPLRFIQSSEKGENKECPFAPEGYDVEYEMTTIEQPLTWFEALRANTIFFKRRGITEEKHWRLFTYPSDTVNFKNIDAELERLANSEGFVADVVVVDYMDILAPEDPRELGRDRVNTSWKAGRRLNTKWHNLLISSSQGKSSVYEGKVQTKADYSEDKRKYAHVTAGFGMSQSPKEKKFGITKYNILVGRDEENSEDTVCYVANSLRMGNPVAASLTPELHWMDLKARPQIAPEQKNSRDRKPAERGRR